MTTDQLLEKPPPTDVCRLADLLFDAFHDGNIEYCLWKGTQSITAGRAGDDDLDLLVAKTGFDDATAVLTELGFKRCVSASGLAPPGVFHYYGYEADTETFVHVHLYTRLLTGESLVQTHWLPAERMLLEDCGMLDGVRVPSPSAELALFIVRMMIKSGFGARTLVVW